MNRTSKRRKFIKSFLGLFMFASMNRGYALVETKTECLTGTDDEGPFYLADAPWRSDLTEGYKGKRGEPLEVTGKVLTSCDEPVANAVVDVWHASPEGKYDMNKKNFLFRGKVRTDENGNYKFNTDMPASYPGRPKHLHIKVHTDKGEQVTTQVYFEGDPKNKRDYLYNRNNGKERTMKLVPDNGGLKADFTIYLA